MPKRHPHYTVRSSPIPTRSEKVTLKTRINVLTYESPQVRRVDQYGFPNTETAFPTLPPPD